MAAVRKLTENFGPGTREGILIYPEGTRFTAERLARAKKVIAERQPENAARANRLQHILPPRLGGPIAVLEETAPCDVVFCGHRVRRPAHGRGHLARQAGGQHDPRALPALPRRRRARPVTRRRWRGCTSAGRRWTTGSASALAPPPPPPPRRERGAGLPAALRGREPVLRLDATTWIAAWPPTRPAPPAATRARGCRWSWPGRGRWTRARRPCARRPGSNACPVRRKTSWSAAGTRALEPDAQTGQQRRLGRRGRVHHVVVVGVVDGGRIAGQADDRGVPVTSSTRRTRSSSLRAASSSLSGRHPPEGRSPGRRRLRRARRRARRRWRDRRLWRVCRSWR